MTSTFHPAPYTDPRRKLVLSFDVGTKTSGISYSILDPGQVPQIKGVTRFPAHEQISGASRIPTVIYYDKAGKVRAVGAEAMREGIDETAEEEEWVKVERFTLHIRPKSGSSSLVTSNIPPLPPGKTVVQVLADFLQYLYQCAKIYIQDTHANGQALWEHVVSEADHIFSHPNGWEGYQQSRIRDAVVLAGIIPNTADGHSRVSFVTDGEASLHFAIDNGLPASAVQAGDGVVVVEAGEGTIDISAYSKMLDTNTTVTTFEEIAAPQCHFHGSVFVSVHARLFLEDHLRESDFLEDLDHIVRCFDRKIKFHFIDDKQPQYIKFGGSRDNDAGCNIRSGMLKLAGTDVATFFEPSVKCIVDSVQTQIKNGHQPIKSAVLLGDFSASDWLLAKVSEALDCKGIKVFRPDCFVNRAKSNGAISFYLSRLARTRASKMAGGPSMDEELRAREKENREKENSKERESMDLEMKTVRDELDVKKKECSDAKNALEQAQKELKNVNDALRNSREETRNGKDALEKAQKELRNVNNALQNSREEVRKGKDALEKAQKELKNVKNTLQDSREEVRNGKDALGKSQKELKNVNDALQNSREEARNGKEALEKTQKELRNVNDTFQKSREEAQNLAAENKQLSDKMNGLKESLALSRKESQSIARRPREEQQVPSPVSSLLNLQSITLSGGAIHNSGVEDKISIDKAMELVQKLNLQIDTTASALVENLVSAASGYPADPLASSTSTTSLNSTQIQEAEWLLGGEELTSLLGFVPAFESSTAGSAKDSNRRLEMLLRIGLTTWSAYHVHSWEIGWNGSSAAGHTEGPSLSPPPSSLPTSSDGSSPFAVIYKKLKLCEDPSVTTKWRSVTRSRIKFSSSAWTQALISSLFSVLSFLGLTYTRPTMLAQELQPLLTAIRSVREALGESVVSKELEVVTVIPGARFDSGCMKDVSVPDPSTFATPSTAKPKRETVVATCGLGLKEVSLDDLRSEKSHLLPQVLRERSFRNL